MSKYWSGLEWLVGCRRMSAPPGEAAVDSGVEREEDDKEFYCDIWAAWRRERPEHSAVIDKFNWRLVKRTVEV